MKIFDAFFPARRRRITAAKRWHDWILSTARSPEPYQSGWVQDTRDGRFQMVALISTLVLRRLRDCDAEGRHLADLVYKAVFSDFDYALREEGVGDSSIARKIRRLGEEFFGLARAIDQALSDSDLENTIATVVVKNQIVSSQQAPDFAVWLININLYLQTTENSVALAGLNEKYSMI